MSIVRQPRSQLRKCQYHLGINRRLPVGASNELEFLRLRKSPESLPSQGKLTFLKDINKHPRIASGRRTSIYQTKYKTNLSCPVHLETF